MIEDGEHVTAVADRKRTTIVRPLLTAMLVGCGYIVVCTLYIWLSGRIVERLSTSVAQAAELERIKGTLFILVTGLGLLVVTYLILRRVVRDQLRLENQHSAMLALERQSTAGVFASSVAHDINNILTGLYGDLHIVKTARGLDEEALHSAERLEKSVDDLTVLSQRLTATGKAGTRGERVEANLSQIVRETVQFARTHKRLRNSICELEEPPQLMAMVNTQLVGQMLLNLILNAADAIPRNGRIRINLRREGQHAIIEVHDNGPGIPPDKIAQIFEPFYTTKANGTGLGLLSVKACAESHGGTVSVGRSLLGGACFAMRLPLDSPLTEPAKPVRAATTTPASQQT